MLSTKDLKYQMVGRRTEKLTERFVGPYKVKKIISSNVVVKDGIQWTEVKDNRQKLLSVPEKYTTSERNVLSDDKKKTPVRS